jgi:glycine/D-amino acid oxidase-like deaminating enzyme
LISNGSAINAGMFDYIVTGAGSAGCAVAARLSENGRSHGHVRSQGSGLGVHGQFSGRCFEPKV